MVEVFIPPAVEPEQPPMSMSTVISIAPDSLMTERSAVLKPAVLAVTDWKREWSMRSFMGSPEYSAKKKNTAGRRSSSPEVTRTTLVCKRYFLKQSLYFTISSQVRNPMPPVIMSSIRMTLTYIFPPKLVMEEKGSRTPIRSKPALQKADTEWKREYHIPFTGPNSRQKTG